MDNFWEKANLLKITLTSLWNSERLAIWKSKIADLRGKVVSVMQGELREYLIVRLKLKELVKEMMKEEMMKEEQMNRKKEE